MKKGAALSLFLRFNLMFLVLLNSGCSLRVLEQHQNKALEPPQKPVPTHTKTGESLFTVIEIEDLEYPTLAASIRLPHRANPNNTVVLAAEYAYITSEKHLHVIDVSIPQLPSYETTLAFPDKVGEVLVSGNHLVVGSHQKFYIVDISVPVQPVIQSTTHLPNRNGIKDMDVRGAYLYVLGEDNYSLYIFSIKFGHAQLDRNYKLAKRWWVLSPKTEHPQIKAFLFPSSLRALTSSIRTPLLEQRGFLQLHPSDGISRSSNEFLVSNDLRSKANDLPNKWEIQRNKKTPGGLVIMDACWLDKVKRKIRTGMAAIYSIKQEYRGLLSEKGKKTFNRQKPRITHTVVDGKMRQIAPDPLMETVDIDNKTLTGRITDFQISGNLLHIISAKGFYTIFRFFNIEDMINRPKVLSTTPLQASSPISIAIGKYYTCVLTTLPKKER